MLLPGLFVRKQDFVRRRHRGVSLLATTALILLSAGAALANPLGGQVVGGNATIQGQGTSTVTVTQSTDRAIIDWNTFNLGAGDKTQFVQPNSSSITLDRVTGGLGASQIYGTIAANGRVFLVNPDGILFGAGAKINAAGFLATTNDIKNVDFMARRYTFTVPGNPAAAITNQGTITAQSGGFAALVAPGVRNTGTITATLGKVTLASGNTFALDFYGDQLIKLAVGDSIAADVKDVATGLPLGSLVKNEGLLKANGGQVTLTAATARKVVDSVINNTGVIEANSFQSQNGKVVLGAATASTKVASTPVQTVKLSGSISVAGKKAKQTGGAVAITGENIVVSGANIDASGQAGGGKVLIGGDVGGGKGNATVAWMPQAALEAWPVPAAASVSVDAATTINASAIAQGDGGKVVVWSDQMTSFGGLIKATGGTQGGNGGFVETSGHTVDFTGIRVDTSAPAAKTGTWLVDPTDLTVDTAAAATISANLATTNVALQTNADGTTSGPGTTGAGPGDINVNAPISWSSGNTLALTANHAININAPITIAGAGGLNLSAAFDPLLTSVPMLFFSLGNSVQFTGTPNIGQSLTINGKTYTLLYSMIDAQNINASNASLSGNFALAKSLDATEVTNWTPIGTNGAGQVLNETGFTGAFEGLGNTIANLKISPASADLIGLFGISGGTIRNVGLLNETVTAAANVTPSGIFVGGLVGMNAGTIAQSFTTGIVNGGSDSFFVGGLVGWNSGSVFQSYATSSVSGTGSVGGLVGLNFNEQLTAANLIGGISQSFATGAVSGTDRVGGLVGTNIGSVLQSYATGPVNGASDVGGLIGFNDTLFNFFSGAITAANAVGITNPLGATDVLGNVSQSYAIGPVTGTSGVGGLIGSNSGKAPTSSYWDTVTNGQATSAGGTGLTTAQFNTGLPSGFDPAVWVSNPNANNGYPFLSWQTVVATTPPPPPPFVPVTTTPLPPPVVPVTTAPPQTPPALPIGLITTATVQPTQILGSPSFPGTDPSTVQISLTLPSAPTVNSPATASGTPQVAAVTAATPSDATTTPSSAAPAVTGITPTLPGIPPLPPPPTITRGVGIPPPGETRFVAHEVVLELGIDASPQRVQEVARRLGLSIVVSERFNALRRAIYRFQFSDNRSITQIIRALEANGIIAGAQPNYVYQVTQDANPQASPPSPGSEAAPAVDGLQASPQEPASYTLPTTGDPAQYVISKLRLDEVHGRVQGKDVLVALIDSEIDRRHPDLQSAIVERFDAGCAADRPDSHGTGMAGAIASRSYLRGIAPQTRILAICAFGGKSATAESTTMQIIRGIDYAVERGARVINMSFAGPRDPMLERALRTAHDKGAALIAAAGNKGPKSPPLYPGADPGVIAVTATDAHDNVFAEANRGSYIAVAAPGVDVMVPSPDNGYALSTGTSVAAANVSGVAALLMETKPKLDPETLRYLLATTAKTLNARSRDEAGSGLVDPVRALAANPRQVAPPQPTASTAKSALPAPPTR